MVFGCIGIYLLEWRGYLSCFSYCSRWLRDYRMGWCNQYRYLWFGYMISCWKPLKSTLQTQKRRTSSSIYQIMVHATLYWKRGDLQWRLISSPALCRSQAYNQTACEKFLLKRLNGIISQLPICRMPKQLFGKSKDKSRIIMKSIHIPHSIWTLQRYSERH